MADILITKDKNIKAVLDGKEYTIKQLALLGGISLVDDFKQYRKDTSDSLSKILETEIKLASILTEIAKL